MRNLMMYFLASLLIPCVVPADNPEERMMRVLTPEQAQAYTDGLASEEIDLPNGETLAEYLARQDAKRQAGLVLRTLEPCRILDTSEAVDKMIPGYSFGLLLRGESRDLSPYGGSAEGCGIPDLEGEIFRSNRARALLLSVEIRDAVESGSLAFESTGSLVAFRPGETTNASSLIVPVCDQESADPCRDGDLQMQLDVDAHVRVIVHGYLEPLDSGPGAGEDSRTVETDTKALTEPFWEKNSNNDNIFYSDGRVGIGTNSPAWALGIGGEEHPRIELRSNQNDFANEVAVGFGNSDRSEYFEIGLDNEGDNAFHIGNRYLTSKYLSVLPNGFVGIGHRDPDSYLTVYGTAHLKSNNPTLRLSDSSVDPGGLGEVWNVRNQNSTFKIYEGSDDGSPKLAIDSSGNVGIGTGAPQSKLDIRGDTRIQSSHLKFYNAHASYPEGFHESQFQQWGRFALTLRSPGNAFAVERVDSDGHETIAFFDRDSARVGIGNKTPLHPLHVTGTVRFDNTIKIGSQESAITDGGNGRMKLTARRAVGTSTAQAFTFSTCDSEGTCFNRLDITGGAVGFRSVSNGEAMRITDANNVGIGTVIPSERLEVDGNIKLSGSLVSDGDICIGQCG